MADTRGREPGRDAEPAPQTLGGRYELGAMLGYGGMAEVFRGRDVRLGRDVAVKVLRSELARDPSFLVRFRREAQSAAALSHPNIVAVYDTGDEVTATGSLPFIVMEYVEGRTLRELLQSEGRLLPRRALEIVAEVCDALEYSHQNGIVHRDIKPGNVMLTRTGGVKVMDFGIARALAASQATVTSTTAVMGTAQYLSPEQARGEHVDARSDVYSTGILLYELLTGRPPFTGDSPVAVAYQHVREDPVPPSAYDPDLAGDLDAVVLKAIAKNPANRYSSAAAFGADVRRAAAGQPVAATPVLSREAPTTVLSTGDDALQTTVLARNAPEPGRGRRGLAYTLLALAVLAVIVIAAVAVRNVANNGSKGTVKVPNLKGLQRVAAEQKLATVGLGVGTETPMTYTSKAPPVGQVVSQSIDDGFSTTAGNKIDFTYSAGTQQTPIPPVVGQSLADATKNLQAAMLKVGSPVLTKEDDSKDPGTVLSIAPPAGQMVGVNTVITLTVVSNTSTVPVINGLSLDDAEQALMQAGFTTGAVVNKVDTSVAPGTVLTSSPGQGRSGIQRQSPVNLYVATTPAPVPVVTTPPPTTAPASAPPGGSTAPTAPATAGASNPAPAPSSP